MNLSDKITIYADAVERLAKHDLVDTTSFCPPQHPDALPGTSFKMTLTFGDDLYLWLVKNSEKVHIAHGTTADTWDPHVTGLYDEFVDIVAALDD